MRHGSLSELILEVEVGGRALLLAQIDSRRAVVRLVQEDLAGRGHAAVEAANVTLFLVFGALMRRARGGDGVGVALVAGVLVEGRAR